ncbi:MAG TPA: TlpA disulfide reductase family protein, partial [Kofleriaceae bacterium]|nr:TlpA disulfide reductase family protein [Kofleriaceae bacterium]
PELSVPFHMRFRVRGDQVYANIAVLRRGTINVGGHARPFALSWSPAGFDYPGARIALDLDGDGKTQLSSWTEESPESFFVMERSLTVAGRGYDFKVAQNGDTLTLTPRTAPLPPRPALTVGTPAFEIAGTDLDGQPVTLSGLRGRTVLVDFWGTSCPPCREALPKLASLYRRHHAEGFDILSILVENPDGPDATRAEAMKLLGAKPYAGHEIIDRNNALLTLYRTMSFPTYFIVDPAGTITCARCELDDVLRKLDHAPAPSPATSAATGL